MRDADLSVVVEAAAGDRRGWDELVRRFGGLVRVTASSFRLTHQDLEDVSQTVWLLLAMHLSKLREPGLPHVIGVGALGPDARPACVSNVISARVRACGVDVVSAFHPGTLPAPPPELERVFSSGLAKWSGTSFSTPRVTGALTEYLLQANQPSGEDALAWLRAHYPPNSPTVRSSLADLPLTRRPPTGHRPARR